jgi:hypothetical protein
MIEYIYEVRTHGKAIMITGCYDVAKKVADKLDKSGEYPAPVYAVEYDYDTELWLQENDEEYMYI